MNIIKRVLKTQAGMFYAILIAGVMLLGTSYSIFVLSTSAITTSEILVGNMLYSVSVYEEGSDTPVSNRTVTVPASSSKSYYIVLASVNNTNTNFKLAYNASTTDGLTISASDRTGYDVSGLIGAYSTYGYKRIIKVNVENTGSAKTIEFNAFGGYNFNNVSKVNLGSGFTALNVSNENVSTSKRNLIDQIEKDLNCTATESHACLYGPNSNGANKIYLKEIDNTDPNNPEEVEVLYYILGVYKLGNTDQDKVVKVIRSDVYEESTYTSANVESALSNFHTNVLSDSLEKSQIYSTNKFDCRKTNEDITSCTSYDGFTSNVGLLSIDEYEITKGYLNNTIASDDHFALDKVNIYNLPSEYQEVKYLESSGEEYIDTGILVNNKTGYELTLQLFDYNYATINLFGASGEERLMYNIIQKFSSNNYSLKYRAGGVSIVCNQLQKNTLKSWYSSTDKQMHFSIGDDEGTFPFYSGLEINRTAYIFGVNDGSASIADIKIRLYDFKITNGDGEYVFNGIPAVRISDNVIGMYDIVNGVFYTNSGSGTFTMGPVINPVKILDLTDNTTDDDSSASSYIKPVFYLKNDTYVEGNGTTSSAYEIVEKPLCVLVSGTSKTVGAKYSCSLDAERIFYVVEDGDNTTLTQGTTGVAGTNEVALLMETNYTDNSVPSTMAWCDPNGNYPSDPLCNHDNLDPLINIIQNAFDSTGQIVTVSLPTYALINATKVNNALPIWTSDYLKNAVHSNAVSGYWTKDAPKSYEGYAVVVTVNGGLTMGAFNESRYFGIRPVITISKDDMN